MRFTIVGAGGFIGGALSDALRAANHEVVALKRGDPFPRKSELGHVIYAAGVTADFRERPFDALHANTMLVADLLKNSRMDSFLYLSSARIYRHASDTTEDAAISLRPDSREDLYDLTKLTAEAICHASGCERVRIARISNVVGADFFSRNFLSELIRTAVDQRNIELRSSPDSAKDYILLEDVVQQLMNIALGGTWNCYNVASGVNVTHRELLASIMAASSARLDVVPNAVRMASPEIDVSRLRDEFGFKPRPVIPRVSELVNEYRNRSDAENRP